MKKTVDEKLFRAVKIMLQGGATYDEIEKFFGISSATITRIKRSESLQEYRQQAAAIQATYKAKAKAAKATEMAPKAPETAPVSEPVKSIDPSGQRPITVQVQATHYMMEELRKQNEILEGISRKLAYIVEQLT